MIFCNNCGTAYEDGLSFCTECGTVAPNALGVTIAPTRKLGTSGAVAVVSSSPSLNSTAPYAETQAFPKVAAPAYPNYSSPTTASKKRTSPALIAVIVSFVVIVSVGVLVYLATRSKSSDSSNTGTRYSTGSPTDRLANSLNQAISNNRLVTQSGDDAYSYYKQLRSMNPQHAALTDIKSRVMQPLRSQGEEVINRKMYHTGLVLRDEWGTTLRVFEWANQLEPSDKSIEARWKYTQGKLAEADNRRAEAMQYFSAAIQLDSSWAVPQNDFGYITTQEKGNDIDKWQTALPFYRRAIELLPTWDIPHNNTGTAYFYLGQYEAAEASYMKAIQLNSNWARPHKWLGDIYSKKGMNADALREYQKAITLYNPNTDSLDIDYLNRRVTQLHSMGY